jgi:copper chaperone CopZ
MPNASTVTTYRVAGMTCGHCVSAVTEELSGLEGVASVDVALDPAGESTVTVTSDRPLPAQQVAAAVDEAGYEVVGTP